MLDLLTRLIPINFSLAFYTIFSHPSSQALQLFYLLDNDKKRPVLTQPLLHCMTPFRNDLHDLRLKCKLAFPSLGRRCWGRVYKNQYQNEYQIAYSCGFSTCLIMKQHVSFSPNLYTTACQFYVTFLVTFKRERHGNRPFSFFRLTLLGMGLQKPIKINIKS